MNHRRNATGLINNAQLKRQKSFEKLESGIQQLLREKRAINFNSVAEASGLSRGWLYKEAEVKARIVQLREQTESTKKIPSKQKPSDTSKDAIIRTVKAKTKKVEAENKALKSQLETVYGQLLNQKELQQKLERLEAENAKLKDRLYSPISTESRAKKVTQLRTISSISERITHELESLEITPSSTLIKQIENASEGVVISAIDALKQQIDSNSIRSPEAWLAAAIRDSWKPNEAIGKTEARKDLIEEWYLLARAYGIVKGRRREDEEWLVQENTGQWFKQQELSSKWTLDYLRQVVKIER